MRIAYVGNFGPPFSTENDIMKTLLSMGHTVHPLQENQTHWRGLRDMALASDMLLWTTTWNVHPPDETMETFRLLKERGIPSVGYHLDLWWGVDRGGRQWRDEMMFHVEHLFTPDGDHPELWEQVGINHHYQPPGVLEESCYLGRRRQAYEGFDVCFVGSDGRHYHPEWPYRAEMVRQLQARFGERFGLFGHVEEKKLRGRLLNDLYASVPVVMGDSLCLQRESSLYWSDRVYEVTGRGGCLIMPRINALDEQFAGLLPMYEWGDWDHMEHLVKHWASSPNAARRRGAELQSVVLAEHTYRHRFNRVFRTIFG